MCLQPFIDNNSYETERDLVFKHGGSKTKSLVFGKIISLYVLPSVCYQSPCVCFNFYLIKSDLFIPTYISFFLPC